MWLQLFHFYNLLEGSELPVISVTGHELGNLWECYVHWGRSTFYRQKQHWSFSLPQVRLANTKNNKSSTIYGTDSYVVSLTSKWVWHCFGMPCFGSVSHLLLTWHNWGQCGRLLVSFCCQLLVKIITYCSLQKELLPKIWCLAVPHWQSGCSSNIIGDESLHVLTYIHWFIWTCDFIRITFISFI